MKVKLPAYVQGILILLGVYLLFSGLYVARGIMIPLAFSLVLSLLLYPVCVKLEEWRFPRWLAIISTMLITLILLGGVFTLISSEIFKFADEIPVMQERLEITLVEVQDFIESKFDIDPESQIVWLENGLNELLSNSGAFLSSFISMTSDFLAKLAIIPFYMFFILYYRDLFKTFIFEATPERDHEQVAQIIKRVQQVIQNYLVGLFTVICIVAFLNVMSLLIIGVDHALFFGIFAALLTVIPYIGVFIGSALPILYTLAMADSLWVPVLVFAAFSLVQTLEGNLISPNITGSKVSINPLAAIIALFVGAEIWGIAGMILFVPLVAMLKVVFDHIDSLKPYGLLLSAEKSDFKLSVFLNILRQRKGKNES